MTEFPIGFDSQAAQNFHAAERQALRDRGFVVEGDFTNPPPERLTVFEGGIATEVPVEAELFPSPEGGMETWFTPKAEITIFEMAR